MDRDPLTETSRMHTAHSLLYGGSCMTETSRQRPPRQRPSPPGQRPAGQRPLDRDPLDRDPQTETPKQHPSSRDPRDRDTQTETPMDRDPLTQTPQDRDPLDRDRDPPAERITDACENITFPQLRLRAVIILQLIFN